MGRSQSTLTKQLKKMEDQLGLSLFRRTSRGIVPTEVAIDLLSRARSVRAELSRFEQEASDLRGQQAGNLRLSAAPLAAVRILPRAIARFRADYPDIDISIASDLFGDALKALREGHHDIVIGPHDASSDVGDIVAEPLFATRMVVITERNAPHARATSLEELLDCCWVMLGGTIGSPRQRFREQFARHGLAPPRIRLSSESRLGLLSLVKELQAVCTFPAQLLDQLSSTHDVSVIQVREELEPLTISMMTRSGRSLTPAGERLADCIRHRAAVIARERAD